MNILVVDDSNTLRFVMVKLLRELGYRDITAVGSAEEAATLVSNNSYDCILLDWNLPKMSGLDFLRLLRSGTSTEKLPVVMVTTVNEKSNILLALKTGIQGYLFKPVQREALSSKLAEIASKQSPAAGEPA